MTSEESSLFTDLYDSYQDQSEPNNKDQEDLADLESEMEPGEKIEVDEEILQNMKKARGGTMQINIEGQASAKRASECTHNYLQVPKETEESLNSSSESTKGGISGSETEQDQDKELNRAIQGLAVEWGKGILTSPEIIEFLDIIASSHHSKQMHNPSSVIRSIEARAMSSKKQLALSLSHSCRWGIKSMLGCMGGIETTILCVTSSQSNSILSGLSTILDSMTIREQEAEKKHLAAQTSLNETTKVFNEHLSIFTSLASKTETLLLTLQDVQNKITSVPVSTPRSLSSHATRERIEPVEIIKAAGTYQCDHGILVLKETGASFEGDGEIAKILASLLTCSRSMKILINLVNIKIDDLVAFSENEEYLFTQLVSGDSTAKVKAYNQLMSICSQGQYQWSKINM